MYEFFVRLLKYTGTETEHDVSYSKNHTHWSEKPSASQYPTKCSNADKNACKCVQKSILFVYFAFVWRIRHKLIYKWVFTAHNMLVQ